MTTNIIKAVVDFVVIIHFSFILFVVFGSVLIVKYPRLIFLHLPSVFWAGYLEFFNKTCPLTPLENYLLTLLNESTYDTGFIAHYILPLIYPEELTRNMQIIMGITLLVINLAFYFLFIIRNLKKLK